MHSFDGAIAFTLTALQLVAAGLSIGFVVWMAMKITDLERRFDLLEESVAQSRRAHRLNDVSAALQQQKKMEQHQQQHAAPALPDEMWRLPVASSPSNASPSSC